MTDEATEAEVCFDDEHKTNVPKEDQEDDNQSYYYFGYGPMVHPMVRERRGINVVEEQPAVLRDFRLTFALAGVAAVVLARGWDVHGVVMKCATREDWEKLQKSEAAPSFYATLEEVHVYDKSNNHDDQEEYSVLPEEEEEEANDHDNPSRIIKAHVFHMVEFDESKLDAPIEKLPQERYLKLIASGMQLYNCSADYIDENIWQVPFIPQRTPENYLTFPKWTPTQDKPTNDEPKTKTTTLPKISLERYQRLAQDQIPLNRLFFLVGNKVLFVYNPNGHPVASYIEQFGAGQPDMSFIVNQLIVDPDIPHCTTRQEITPSIVQWAENDLVETIIEMGGIAAHHVMDLTDDDDCEEMNESDLAVFLEQLREELATQTAADEDTMDSSLSGAAVAFSRESSIEEGMVQVVEEETTTALSSSRSGGAGGRGRRKSRLSGVFKSLKFNRRSHKEKGNEDKGGEATDHRRRKTWAPGFRSSRRDDNNNNIPPKTSIQ